MTTPSSTLTRRAFAKRAAVATAAFQVIPGHVLGLNGQTPPSNRLNVAGVGVGGMGGHNIKVCSEVANIVALCDVDVNYAAKTFKAHPNAKTYTDYREMLDKQKDIDAVVVATPDHTHAPVRWRACARQACRQEADGVFGRRSARNDRARKYKVIADGQSRTPGTACAWLRWIGPVRSARYAKSTHGPTARSGRKASRSSVRKRPRLFRLALTGTNGSARHRCAPTIPAITPTVGARGATSAQDRWETSVAM